MAAPEPAQAVDATDQFMASLAAQHARSIAGFFDAPAPPLQSSPAVGATAEQNWNDFAASYRARKEALERSRGFNVRPGRTRSEQPHASGPATWPGPKFQPEA